MSNTKYSAASPTIADTVIPEGVENYGKHHHVAGYHVEGHTTGLLNWHGARTGYFEARCHGCRWVGPTRYLTPEGVCTTRGFAKGDVAEGVTPGGYAELTALLDAEALAHVVSELA